MKLKEVLKSHGNLVESFLSLSTINAINTILPLISLPYMLRVIGKAYYGSYAYIYVIEDYLLLFTTFGFIYSATKEVSQCREDKETLNKIYTSVLVTKSIIFLIVLSVFLIVSPFVLHSKEEYFMFFIGLGIVISDILMPTYLYQGLERMRYLTIVNTLPKLIFTVLIFIIIKKPSDYIYIILLNSIGFILAGILSTIIAHRHLKVKFVRVSYNDIKSQIVGSSSVFASNIGISFYRNANTLILGLFCSDSVVGVYAAAEKIIKALQGVVNPISQALFPHVSNVLKCSTSMARAKYIMKLCVKLCPVLVAGVILTYIFAPLLSNMILGKDFSDAIPLIRIMSIVVLFGCLNYILGFVGMVNNNASELFFKYVIIAGLANIIIVSLFASSFSYYAAARNIVISEGLLFLLCLIYFIKMRRTSIL